MRTQREASQMVGYTRIACVVLSVIVTLVALYFQFFSVGLSAWGLDFPATLAIQLVMIFGLPALAVIFLICLFGGVKWSILATGWMLIWQLLLCALVLVTLCDLGSASQFRVTALNRYPDLLGFVLGSLAVALSVGLFRARNWARRK